MQLAIDEARRAEGRTRPNPIVGCAIVKAGKLVATGFHERAGQSHAEAAALAKAGAKAKGADVYVTLEPCNHHGRTPPCSEALIRARVKRLFVGTTDPNPKVKGGGAARLREAGIEVHTDVHAAACARLNEVFVHFVTKREPFVHLKLAMSLDGKVATRTGASKWITSSEARARGHELRNRADALVVGVGTVLVDDPELTCRLPGGRDPIRVIVDTHARTPVTSSVVRLAASSAAPTWIVVGEGADAKRVHALERAGAGVLRVATEHGRVSLPELLAVLAQREVTSILVEGGPTLVGAFVDARRVNRVHAFIAPKLIGGLEARMAVEGHGVAALDEAFALDALEAERVGPDLYVTGAVRG